MDDTNFDDLLKGKFADYEHPDLGSTALDSFHERMKSIPKVPWNVKYRTEVYVTSAFVLFTLLNGLIVWYGIKGDGNSLRDLNARVTHETVDSLKRVINQLKVDQQKASVFIINPPDIAINKTEDEKNAIPNLVHNTSKSNPELSTNTKLHLGSIDSLPSGIFERLTEEGVLETQNGEAYLIITDRIKQVRHKSFASYASLSQVTIMDEAIRADSLKQDETFKQPGVKLSKGISLKLINKLADQKYTGGIGINLAPHLDLVKMDYSQGNGSLTPRIGLTAEWVVSPHWSVETSIDYLTTKFTINKNFESFNLPNLSTELGKLESAQISSRTLSAPVNLKYRLWLSQKHQLLFKAGFTPYFYLRNQYIYKYPYPNRPPDSDLSVSTVEQNDQSGYYGGTFNMAIGLSRLLKNKNQFEVDLFYENSLGKVSTEKLGMQLFGIRTAYSIRVK